MLENSFLFAADLVREVSTDRCHFVRSETRDIRFGGQEYREIFFSAAPSLRGRDVLVVDAVSEYRCYAGLPAEAPGRGQSAVAAAGGSVRQAGSPGR